MSVLYVKDNCSFSEKARAVLDAYDVAFEEKNISDRDVLKELMDIGGKKQTPFFVDEDGSMYESDDIMTYIEKKYGSGLLHTA
jgi:glutathione S-transferase